MKGYISDDDFDFNSKQWLKKLKETYDTPLRVKGREELQEDDQNDFVVLGYTLVFRQEYHEIWNLHKENLVQCYGDIHDQYLKSHSPESDYNKDLCPIYIITVESKKPQFEMPFYIGKTHDHTHRFKNGHLATQKLHLPFFSKFNKHVYFAQVWVKYKHYETEWHVPLEWMGPYDLIKDILTFIENTLIFQEGTRLGNRSGTETRRRKTNYRDWDDYFPKCYFKVVVDPLINSDYLNELQQESTIVGPEINDLEFKNDNDHDEDDSYFDIENYYENISEVL